MSKGYAYCLRCKYNDLSATHDSCFYCYDGRNFEMKDKKMSKSKLDELIKKIKEEINKINKMKQGNYHEVWKEEGTLPTLKKYLPDIEACKKEQEELIKLIKDIKNDFSVSDSYIRNRTDLLEEL